MPKLIPFKPSIRQLITLVFALLFTCLVNAQSKLPANVFQIAGGYSRHGSGDMKGIVFGADYIKYITDKLSLDYNFKAGINDGKDLILITNTATGMIRDASIRFTTAGVQIGINGGYSIIRNRQHEFMVSLGGFGRYQSSSNGNDGYEMYDPARTGQPTILIGYDNRTPQKTFSVGGIFQLHYNFTIDNKIYIGLLPGFQTDTNGDAILQVALTVGRRL